MECIDYPLKTFCSIPSLQAETTREQNTAGTIRFISISFLAPIRVFLHLSKFHFFLINQPKENSWGSCASSQTKNLVRHQSSQLHRKLFEPRLHHASKLPSHTVRNEKPIPGIASERGPDREQLILTKPAVFHQSGTGLFLLWRGA